MTTDPPRSRSRSPGDEPRGGSHLVVSSSRERRHPGALAIGLLISVLLHGLFLLLYPRMMRTLEPDAEAVGEPAPRRTVAGTRIVELREVPPEEEPAPEPVPEEEPEPEPAEEPEEATAEEAARAPAAAEPTTGPTETAAERLRPSMTDPRLWRPPEDALTELSPDEKARLRLFVRFRALGDSMAGAAEEAGPDTDWTFTDEEGERWGVSPGKLHLGTITLPLPLAFEGASDELGEEDLDAWFRREIERGALEAEIREVWKERAKAIRERKDRERREKADSTSSDPSPR